MTDYEKRVLDGFKCGFYNTDYVMGALMDQDVYEKYQQEVKRIRLLLTEFNALNKSVEVEG